MDAGTEVKEPASDEPALIAEDVGYPVEWFQTTPPANLLCSICQEVARNPLNLYCPHLGCRRCLQRACETDKRCPICRTLIPNVGNLLPNFYVVNLINALP